MRNKREGQPDYRSPQPISLQPISRRSLLKVTAAGAGLLFGSLFASPQGEVRRVFALGREAEGRKDSLYVRPGVIEDLLNDIHNRFPGTSLNEKQKRIDSAVQGLNELRYSGGVDRGANMSPEEPIEPGKYVAYLNPEGGDFKTKGDGNPLAFAIRDMANFTMEGPGTYGLYTFTVYPGLDDVFPPADGALLRVAPPFRDGQIKTRELFLLNDMVQEAQEKAPDMNDPLEASQYLLDRIRGANIVNFSYGPGRQLPENFEGLIIMVDEELRSNKFMRHVGRIPLTNGIEHLVRGPYGGPGAYQVSAPYGLPGRMSVPTHAFAVNLRRGR